MIEHMVTSPVDNRKEARDGLRLTMRALPFVAAGAALWHIPVESYFVRVPLAIVAIALFFYAAMGLFVATVTFRNLVCRRLWVSRRPLLVRSVGGLAIAIMVAVLTGIFFSIGALMND